MQNARQKLCNHFRFLPGRSFRLSKDDFSAGHPIALYSSFNFRRLSHQHTIDNYGSDINSKIIATARHNCIDTI